ncbi:hypothetical protein QKW35_03260 [Pontibacterium granulatum]|uniref:hypothetical protein n=1 Tax=Pontibacterium granulatum TaxID=2036029 RepID=UPI002499F728|nr:hypothetical protein [Pontibacterium granulatum]MDI3323385.1 hypothetical protein [Pontibacterium granulatum]
MSHTEKITQWIDLNDQQQCEWTYKYLTKKWPGFLSNQYHHLEPSTQIVSFINTVRDIPEDRELIEKMRAAWRQERYRKSNRKRNKEQHSFVLSKSVNTQLDYLARQLGGTRNQALEALITDQYKQEKQERKKRQLEVREIRNRERWNEVLGAIPLKDHQKALSDLETLNQKYKELQETLNLLNRKHEETKDELEALRKSPESSHTPATVQALSQTSSSKEPLHKRKTITLVVKKRRSTKNILSERRRKRLSKKLQEQVRQRQLGTKRAPKPRKLTRQ